MIRDDVFGSVDGFRNFDDKKCNQYLSCCSAVTFFIIPLLVVVRSHLDHSSYSPNMAIAISIAIIDIVIRQIHPTIKNFNFNKAIIITNLLLQRNYDITPLNIIDNYN